MCPGIIFDKTYIGIGKHFLLQRMFKRVHGINEVSGGRPQTSYQRVKYLTVWRPTNSC